jgi:uncharacterized protein
MTRLAVRIQPGARANEVIGWIADARGGESLKIRLRAPAIEGKANAALVDFLAEVLGVRVRQITLEWGEKSRDKVVFVEGLTAEQIRLRVPG